MLYLIAIVLMVLWMIAVLSGYTVIGPFIHILLAVALIMLVINLLSVRRSLR